MPVCKLCNNTFPNRIVIGGKTKHLGKRSYCLKCSPTPNNRQRFSTNNNRERQCTKCGKWLPHESFYHKDRNHTRRYAHCKSCHIQHVDDRLISRKLKAIDYLGGKCGDCKNVFHYAVYDFHHTHDKQYAWNKLKYRSWTTIKQELDKCVLLCANCHRMRHVNT